LPPPPPREPTPVPPPPPPDEAAVITAAATPPARAVAPLDESVSVDIEVSVANGAVAPAASPVPDVAFEDRIASLLADEQYEAPLAAEEPEEEPFRLVSSIPPPPSRALPPMPAVPPPGPLGEAAILAEALEVESAEVAVSLEEASALELDAAPDAVVLLAERGERDAWAARAAWLYSEAPPSEDADGRARALVVVAELFGMAGEERRAEEVAGEALALRPSAPLATRQLRSLLVARGAWNEACETLDREARTAPTAAAQAHASGLGAELARLTQGDAEGATQRYAQLERTTPGDVRPWLWRATRSLAGGAQPAESAPEPELDAACERLRLVRSDGEEGDPAADPAAHVALLGARRALRRRDLSGALEALGRLGAGAGLAGPSDWLRAALALPHAALRPQAREAAARLRAADAVLADRLAVRSAIELADGAEVLRLVDAAPDEVLDAPDRTALVALYGDGGRPDALGPWLADAAGSEAAAPLAAAATACLGAERPIPIGDEISRATVDLGRRLAALAAGPAPAADEPAAPLVDAALREAAERVIEAEPRHGVARALLLEHWVATAQRRRIAEALEDGAERDAVRRDAALVAAVLAELDGDRAGFSRALERGRAAAPGHEALLRMRLPDADAEEAASLLVELAEATSDRVAGAIALTEAGLRLLGTGTHAAEGEALLKRASETAPEIPVASFVGLSGARELGDPDAERFWLGQRRAVEATPLDLLPDLVREALRMPEADRALRASLLEDALRVVPHDACLRAAFELASTEVSDRARWLLDAAASPAHRAHGAGLAIEAALLAELDGDLELAARAATRALEGGDVLAPLFLLRYALRGHGVEAAIERLGSEMRREPEMAPRHDVARVMAAVELRGRPSPERARAVLTDVLDEAPEDLLTLHALAATLREEAAPAVLERVASGLARTLGGAEAVAHAMLAARLRVAEERPAEIHELARIAYRHEPRNPWTLRTLAAHARAHGDLALAADCDLELGTRAAGALDQATLLVRVAEARLGRGEDESAAGLLERAVDLWPAHPVARLELAALRERAGRAGDAANAYEELARLLQQPAERARKLHKAATLWLATGGPEAQAEGRRLLELAIEADAALGDAFDRLRDVYAAMGARREIAELLGRRIAVTASPAERASLEIERSAILAAQGDAVEARRALEAALVARPDDVDALGAYAELCERQSDWEAAERTLLTLGRLVADPERQAELYMRMGVLYDERLANVERAEKAYLEVLKRAPSLLGAREKLVALYLRTDQTAKAFEQQEALIAAAGTPGDKCARVVRLAEIHEAAGDLKQAEATLLQARRSWAKEPEPVAGLCRLYARTDRKAAADQLLERAAGEVKRGLGAGRLEESLFATAAVVAELRGELDRAALARAALAALEGRPSGLAGAGLAAARSEHDDLLAPEVFGAPLRALLKTSGVMLDAGAPLDLRALRVKPLGPPHTAVLERTWELGAAYGLPRIEVFVSPSVGSTCTPARSEPPTLVFGQSLVESDRADVREFLMHRALKVLQARTVALARTAPIDLWPLVGAWLKLHSPSFVPVGADAAKVNEFHARMTAAGPRPLDPQLNLLASEVIRSLGNRASSLSVLANAWGARTALLATGDPSLALEGLGWTSGHPQGPPTEPGERLRWVGRSAEARDLLAFCVSDALAALRKRLGVSRYAALEEELTPDIDPITIESE
jgi:tetratricopeptide (TPR) repeat protein